MIFKTQFCASADSAKHHSAKQKKDIAGPRKPAMNIQHSIRKRMGIVNKNLQAPQRLEAYCVST
jgi:hypothetical protein